VPVPSDKTSVSRREIVMKSFSACKLTVLLIAAAWVATINAVLGGTNAAALNAPALGDGFFRVRQPQ